MILKPGPAGLRPPGPFFARLPPFGRSLPAFTFEKGGPGKNFGTVWMLSAGKLTPPAPPRFFIRARRLVKL